jgi:hypothetical protein
MGCSLRYKINVMEAFAEGKCIECRAKSKRKWEDIYIPLWNWEDYHYRVKLAYYVRLKSPKELL